MKEAMLRQQLVDEYQRLDVDGLLALSAGNLSCRFETGMLITASGISASSISVDNIVHLSLQGATKGVHKPSSEWQMHAAIYREFADTQAVVHTHSDYCVALASHGKDLPGFHYMVGMLGSDHVPCTAYHTFGTTELAAAAVQGLRACNACLLANHGMISKGGSLEQAARGASLLELLSKQYMLSLALGPPATLSDAQWAEFFAQMKQTDYQVVQ
ncbi:MAG: class II aldolase/adducin family protein [Pseudomonadales bacterium]